MFEGRAPAERSRLVRQAARLIVEEALEAEAGRGARARLLRAWSGAARLPQRLSAG
ncbi:MAG: hypothetical protein RML56_04940 [Burkholderiales bacterium]|nr:hypothetical protein [Burkholderiales bacterium]